MSVKWVRDPQAEEILKTAGVKYEVLTCKVADTLVKEGLANNARLDGEAVDDDTVEDYAFAMEQGRPFPMLVMHRRLEGLFPLSGNQRLAALILKGEKTYEACVVDCDNALVVDDIIRTANRVHGRRQTREEALRHAASQITEFNLSAAKAAEKFGVEEKSLQRYLRATRVATRLHILGVQHVDTKLNPTSLLALSKVDSNQNVLREAAKLSIRHSLSCADIGRLVDAVKKAPSEESKQLAAIGRFDSKIAVHRRENAANRRTQPLKVQFTTRLQALLTFLRTQDAVEWRQLQITGAAEAAELQGESLEVIQLLKQLMEGKRASSSKRPAIAARG